MWWSIYQLNCQAPVLASEVVAAALSGSKLPECGFRFTGRKWGYQVLRSEMGYVEVQLGSYSEVE